MLSSDQHIINKTATTLAQICVAPRAIKSQYKLALGVIIIPQ